MSNESQVREAVASFYACLARIFEGDVAPMSELWSHADDVTYMGPFGGSQIGWDAVRAEWERQAAMAIGGTVECEVLCINAAEDLGIAHNIEHCTGDAAGARAATDLRVTNMFRRENGAWKMIGHHTDRLPGA